jgi:hypothetical protein
METTSLAVNTAVTQTKSACADSQVSRNSQSIEITTQGNRGAIAHFAQQTHNKPISKLHLTEKHYT